MKNGFTVVVCSFVLAIAFLILDYFLPRGFAAGLPYVACVLIVFWSPRLSDIFVIAFTCAALTLFGFLISQPNITDGAAVIDIVNRSLSIFAILVTALIGWQRKKAELKLQDSNALLEEANQKLADRADATQKTAEAQKEELSRIATSLDKEAIERKRTEENYQRTIARYRSLIEALPINVFQKDPKGRLIFGNRRYFETLGLQEKDAIGKTDFDLFPKELAQKYFQDDQLVVEEGKTIEDIEEHIRLAGDKLYVQVFKAPVLDDKGKIVGLQGMFWDVTARILAEQAQQQSDARFRRLVKSNIIGIMSGTFDGRIIDANEAYLNMIGYSLDDITTGKLSWKSITPPEYQLIDNEMEDLLRDRAYCPPVEKEYIHKSGRRVNVLIGAARLEGTESECICFVLDITERKRAELELRRAKEAADAANKTKTLFLANISHEVRTPLNAIIGMTELVLQNNIAPEQREYLRMVLESGESLLHIIDDILDFSKVEAGKLTLDPQPMRLREKLSETMRSMAVRAHGKGLELVIDVASDVPDCLVGDAGRLRQVLVNLVGNAIKFTEAGEVVVTTVVADETDDDVTLHFSVSDTGIGISEKGQKVVFDAFEQADKTSTRKYGGTGLGLAICSNLVELMGGNIWLESEVGKGSTFHFTCRLKNELDPVEEPRRMSSHSKVLIVDDNLASANAIADMMIGWDLSPVIAENSAKGFDLFSSAESNGAPFELCLIDSDMPISDGFELVDRMLTAPNVNSCDADSRAATVLMLLNSTNAAEGISRCEAMGVAGYLLKPLSPSDLFDASSGILSRDFDSQLKSICEEPELNRIPPLRILLAEDSLVNQKLMMGLLGQQNHDIRLARNGVEAVDAFHRENFDLVLMDVQMPDMNGLDATRQIRKMESNLENKTPIIALTAHAGTEDRRKCLEAGMDEFITKPIRAQKLFNLILSIVIASPKLVELAEQHNLVGLPSPENGSNPTNNGHTAAMENCIDWEKALSAVNDDEALIRTLVDAFFEECPKLIGSINDAIQTRNAELLQQNAHTLKGSMRLFGAEKGYELTFALENMGADAHFANANLVLDDLGIELEKISGALRTKLGQNC